MTHSTPATATHTNPSQAAVSLKTQAGSPKPDIFNKQKTFMQSYREYYQLQLAGRLGDKRPTLNSWVISRYGMDTAKLFEVYDRLTHRLQGCNVHQRINFREQAANALPDWSQQSARLNKMWRAWA